jgi:hypothetical protein
MQIVDPNEGGNWQGLGGVSYVMYLGAPGGVELSVRAGDGIFGEAAGSVEGRGSCITGRHPGRWCGAVDDVLQ